MEKEWDNILVILFLGAAMLITIVYAPGAEWTPAVLSGITGGLIGFLTKSGMTKIKDIQAPKNPKP